MCLCRAQHGQPGGRTVPALGPRLASPAHDAHGRSGEKGEADPPGQPARPSGLYVHGRAPPEIKYPPERHQGPRAPEPWSKGMQEISVAGLCWVLG